MLELVQRRKASGDIQGAADMLERAAGHLDAERLQALLRDLEQRASRAGDLRLAARLLEQLRLQTPTDELVWRPLLDRYIQLADGPRVDQLVADTLPLLVDPARRNELRLARARFLLSQDEHHPQAVETLRDILMDDARNDEALGLLAAYYKRSGAEGDLVDLLEQQFEMAGQAGNLDSAAQLALQLGEVLERTDPDRVAAAYERGLQVVPGHRELLRRLLARTAPADITADKATLMEDLLAADAGADAGQLARDLADAWTRLGDEEAVRRVLEKGCALVADDQALAGRLEEWYRANDAWGPLAELLATEAGREADAQEAVALLCEAATLQAERMGDPAAALALLERARERAPADAELLARLARARVARGDAPGAIAEVQAVLEGAGLPAEGRLPLLRLLAELHAARSDRRAAAAALQQAHAIAPQVVFDDLVQALSAWRDQAASGGDVPAQQEATLALAKVLRDGGALVEARQVLEEAMAAEAANLEIAQLAGELAEAAGDLEEALGAATELLRLARDEEARVAAAERLAALAERIGRPAEIIGELEAALGASPGNARLFQLVSRLYEAAGQHRKLALLLFETASRCEEEIERFQRLSRAGALFVQCGEGSTAVMALNEALAVRPDDQPTVLLLSDAYILAGALQEAADLLKPLITAHKGKASPALASLWGQVARIAAKAGDTKSELQALSRALDADRKNGVLAALLADRAEEAGDDELVTKALRSITAHQPAGPISVPVALLRQAKMAKRRGENDRAVLFARRAAQEATQGDPVLAESREFLKSVGAS
jgi:predicted Zn-dependent protease